MSIEEKAKAYDKAIERANELLYTSNKESLQYKTIESILLELKESNDERIRKAIISFLKRRMQVDSSIPAAIGSWIAWLEKQGEYKPADKTEPKFNVDDWVVWDNKISCHVDNIYQGRESLMYTITDTNNMTRSYSVKGFDNNAHLWTIKDAKDGDVLATLDYILVFKEFLKNDGGISYCHYDFGAGNPQFIWFEDKNWYFGKEAIIHPATKEQRDTLERVMTNAGYEWDAEKKELKKIEQNYEQGK